MKSARAVSARSRSLAIGMRAAGAMALALMLSSCTLLGGDSGAKTPARRIPRSPPPRPPNSAAIYTQQVDWAPCESDFQCAKVKVPLDYSKPDGESIEIAALKTAQQGQQQEGQPAGQPRRPGRLRATTSSGTPAPPTSRKRSASNYDIVGFDPRGVKRSAPVTCLTDQERDASRAKIYALDTDAGLAECPRRQQGHRRQVRGEDRSRPGPHRHRQRRQGSRHPARRAQRHQAELPGLLLRHVPRLHLRLAVPGQRRPDGPRRRDGSVAEL